MKNVTRYIKGHKFVSLYFCTSYSKTLLIFYVLYDIIENQMIKKESQASKELKNLLYGLPPGEGFLASCICRQISLTTDVAYRDVFRMLGSCYGRKWFKKDFKRVRKHDANFVGRRKGDADG